MKSVNWFSKLGVHVLLCGLFLSFSLVAQANQTTPAQQGSAATNSVLNQVGKDISEAYNGSLLEQGVNGVGEVLTDVNTAVQSVASGLTTGVEGFANFLGVNQAGLSGGGIPPGVANGGILPGPGSASGGVIYVRDLLLPKITNFIVSVILAGSVVVFIIAGLMYMVGGGDQEMQNKARETVVWASIGTALAILSYVIVRIIININFLG